MVFVPQEMVLSMVEVSFIYIYIYNMYIYIYLSIYIYIYLFIDIFFLEGYQAFLATLAGEVPAPDESIRNLPQGDPKNQW